jgi:hypothetical protein
MWAPGWAETGCMGETTIGGYEVLGELGDSKRFRAFRASRRAPAGEDVGTLYLMTDEVRHPDLFIETVDTIRAAWPFPVEMDRDYVLPKAQLWTGRPWFFVPEMLPVASEGRIVGRAAFASLRAQLRWLEQFHPPGGEPHFAHGDVRKERIALFDEEHPLLIAPGWVAASELARGKSLSHVRGDDAWHLGKLWILESDHSFVPEGMEPEPDEAARRLPRARLPQRSNGGSAPAREARRTNGANGREAPPKRRPAETPAPARGAPKRDASAITAAPAARTARPVRQTPPGREAADARQSPFHREAPPAREPAARDAPPVRQAAREASPFRDNPPLREAPRDVAREGREPFFASPTAPPVRSPGAPPVRTPAATSGSAPARLHATTAPTVPVTPLRTPAGPPVSAAPAAGSLPPLRDATAGARPRPARPTPAQLSSPPAYDEVSSHADHSPGAPPLEQGRPEPARSAPHAPPEPSARLAPVAASYYPPKQAAADPAVPTQAPTSILPSPAPMAAPAPKRRGVQVAIVLVLLLLVAVFVVALTMLKR